MLINFWGRYSVMKKLIFLFSLLLISCSNVSVQQQKSMSPQIIEKPNSASEYADALLLELQSTHSKIERKRNVLNIIIVDYFTKENKLSSSGKNNLKKIASILADFEKSRITIFGYESGFKDRNLNQKISDDRANAIADIFENDSKIQDLRLYVEGKASDKKIQAEIIIVPTLKK